MDPVLINGEQPGLVASRGEWKGLSTFMSSSMYGLKKKNNYKLVWFKNFSQDVENFWVKEGWAIKSFINDLTVVLPLVVRKLILWHSTPQNLS